MSEPLRVAFVFASRGIGGAERSMLRLIARAHPAPFACRVVVPAPENRALRDAVRAAGVPYHAFSPLDAIGLYRLLRCERPDVFYVFGRFRTAAWAAVARLAGVRCVVAAERSAANRFSDRLARTLDRRFVTAYVANSECAARNLRAIVGADGPPVRVVPNGVEEADVPRAADGPPSLLCVSNVTANKGHRVLLEAVRRLRGRHPDLRAVLAGADGTRGRFFQEAAARGLGDTYTAVGFVDDVRPYLARATLVVLPTLRREGMPTSLLEAMRAGVPVVASRVGGVGEIVEDGVTGLLVTPGDPVGLAGAIGRLLDDEAARSRLAAAAKAYVLAHHGLPAMVDGHRAVFHEALSLATAGRTEAARRSAGRERAATVAHVTAVAGSLRYLLLGQLAALREGGYEVTGVSSPGDDVAALEAHGIPHAAVPMTRRLTPLADLGALVRLYRLMRRRRFTIVHTHTPKPGLLGQAAARMAGVPVVVNTLHGFYFHERMRPPVRRFYATLERISARFSDVILSQNEEDVATAIREGIARPGQIRLLGNGIDVRRFDPARVPPETRRRTRAALGIGEDAPVVGFVGRLVAEKGVRELLEAAVAIRHRFPALRLLLVGCVDEEKADRITPDGAGALGREGLCVFTGFRQDMPELYASMDVFVLPSHREGFPRAPMEASAMKVPCVVTDVRGCRQAVTHGRNGLLVPLGDARALAEAVVALLADRDLARRLGNEGRRRALLEFDERRVFATVLAEYERLLHEKGLRGRVPIAAPEAYPETLAASR
jgi:glycosyltransferase involved in cell wall biosynthesis